MDTNLTSLRLDELDMEEIRDAIGGGFAVSISEDIAKVCMYIYTFHGLRAIFVICSTL